MVGSLTRGRWHVLLVLQDTVVDFNPFANGGAGAGTG